MAKATDSKEKTLAAAALLFRRQGFHGTALHDVLAAAGSPGARYISIFRAEKSRSARRRSISQAKRCGRRSHMAAEATGNAEIFLTGIVRAMAADLEKSDYCNGCPIATTALETAAQSEVLARRRGAAFESWEQRNRARAGAFRRKGRRCGDSSHRHPQPGRRRALACAHLSQRRAAAPRGSSGEVTCEDHAVMMRNTRSGFCFAMLMGKGNGAQERTRTFTAVKPLAPEASASTNSATWARAGY